MEKNNLRHLLTSVYDSQNSQEIFIKSNIEDRLLYSPQ